jgi:DNA-binding XRE family transcriptional regulator
MTIQNYRIFSKIEYYLYIVLIANIIANRILAVARNRGQGMARSSFMRARPSEGHQVRGRADEIDIAIGKAVRFFRIQAGMSLATLGSKLGVTFQQFQKYESGANRIGSGRLLKIAKLFNEPIAAFYPMSGNGKRTDRLEIVLPRVRGN